LGRTQSPTAESLDDDLGSGPPTRNGSFTSIATANAENAISPRGRKAQLNEPVPAQSQRLKLSSASDPLISTDTLQPAAPETMTEPPAESWAAWPSLERATATVQKIAGSEPRRPRLYRSGIIKDETWAENAVEKLTQLGFHALLIHKTYVVAVLPRSGWTLYGPEGCCGSSATPRFAGFKSHPVNVIPALDHYPGSSQTQFCFERTARRVHGKQCARTPSRILLRCGASQTPPRQLACRV